MFCWSSKAPKSHKCKHECHRIRQNVCKRNCPAEAAASGWSGPTALAPWEVSALTELPQDFRPRLCWPLRSLGFCVCWCVSVFVGVVVCTSEYRWRARINLRCCSQGPPILFVGPGLFSGTQSLPSKLGWLAGKLQTEPSPQLDLGFFSSLCLVFLEFVCACM